MLVHGVFSASNKFGYPPLLTYKRYTKTTILSQAVIERLESKGVKFSLVDDCAEAMLRIATDKTINGTRIWALIHHFKLWSINNWA